MPVTHSLCEDIVYVATIDLGSGIQKLTSSSRPLRYDNERRRFTIYSEDVTLIGTYNIIVNAHIKGWPDNKATTQTITLKIYNPCDQVQVIAPKKPHLLDYYYQNAETPSSVIEFNTEE